LTFLPENDKYNGVVDRHILKNKIMMGIAIR